MVQRLHVSSGGGELRRSSTAALTRGRDARRLPADVSVPVFRWWRLNLEVTRPMATRRRCSKIPGRRHDEHTQQRRRQHAAHHRRGDAAPSSSEPVPLPHRIGSRPAMTTATVMALGRTRACAFADRRQQVASSSGSPRQSRRKRVLQVDEHDDAELGRDTGQRDEADRAWQPRSHGQRPDEPEAARPARTARRPSPAPHHRCRKSSTEARRSPPASRARRA